MNLPVRMWFLFFFEQQLFISVFPDGTRAVQWNNRSCYTGYIRGLCRFLLTSPLSTVALSCNTNNKQNTDQLFPPLFICWFHVRFIIIFAWLQMFLNLRNVQRCKSRGMLLTNLEMVKWPTEQMANAAQKDLIHVYSELPWCLSIKPSKQLCSKYLTTAGNPARPSWFDAATPRAAYVASQTATYQQLEHLFFISTVNWQS